MLKALTGRRTVPNIISNFESLGGSDEITLLHHEGTLKKKLLTYSLIT
jgi:glutaredoxin